MATLTTSWKTYASATFSTGYATIAFYLEAKYSTQSIANNTTAVQTRLRSAYTKGNSTAGSGYRFTCTYASTKSGSGVWTFENEVIISGSSTVTHSSDGTKSISLSASAHNDYWNFTKSLSATVSLPTIKRKATITSAPDFNDTDNPILKYSNPAGNSVSTLQARIQSSSGTVYAAYRDIPKTGTSYQFPLTQTERTALLNACPNSKTLAVQFVLKTVIGGTTFTDPVNKTMTVIDANPILINDNCSFQEQNSKAIEYLETDSAEVVIQNISKVRMTASPIANKSATISKVTISKDGTTISLDTAPYQTDVDITSNNFNIVATDSRGYTSTPAIEYKPTMIEYQPVKRNKLIISRTSPTEDDIRMQLESVYYQTTFGSTQNEPIVSYKIGNEGTWQTLTKGADYTIDTTNHKITADLTFLNALPYTEPSTFFIKVEDLLSEWIDSEPIPKGIPVFEFGDDEVQVNGDLIIADTNRENPVSIFSILGLDTNTYDSTHTYAVGDLTIYAHAIYECNTAITTPEEWDSSKWDLVPIIKQ